MIRLIHGIALSPDESELWLADAANSRVHVFDATSMPPKQLASSRGLIFLTTTEWSRRTARNVEARPRSRAD